ncbi:MAG TPA: hypothetical protein VHO03_16955 [Ignavibacteriales bacterium]|nr:hypothetical protein [Ignavibacteriales bacterium]
MLNWIKNISQDTINVLKIITVLSLISVLFLWVTFTYAITLSSFSVGMVKFVISVSVVWIVDKVGFRRVDTLKLLEGNAIAYSIFLLGLCVLAAACISSS